MADKDSLFKRIFNSQQNPLSESIQKVNRTSVERKKVVEERNQKANTTKRKEADDFMMSQLSPAAKERYNPKPKP